MLMITCNIWGLSIIPMSLVTEVDGIIERLGGLYKDEGDPGVGYSLSCTDGSVGTSTEGAAEIP